MHPEQVIPFTEDEWEAIHWALCFRWQGTQPGDYVLPATAPPDIRDSSRNEALLRKVENARRLQAQRDRVNAPSG